MIKTPRQEKKWVTSFRGEYLGDIIQSFGLDLFSSPSLVKTGGKYYPHTTTANSVLSVTAPADFVSANLSNGVTRVLKTWAVADNKVVLRAADGSAFSQDLSVGFTLAETTGLGSDLLSVADDSGDALAVTEVAIPQGEGGMQIMGSGDKQKWAQSFTQVQGPFKQLSFYAFRTSSVPADNLVIEIQSDNAGTPSGVVLTSLTLIPSTFTTTSTLYSYKNTDFTVSSLNFELDKTYHIVFSRSGAASTSSYITCNLVFAEVDPDDTDNTNDPYPNGSLLQYNGSTWTRSATKYTRTDTFTADGTWTVPTGVTSATVEAWGAGGSSNDDVGGGGGGAYSRSTITGLVAGENYAVKVGTAATDQNGGQSSFSPVTAQVLVVGGGGAGGSNTTSSNRATGGGGGGQVIDRVVSLGQQSYTVTVGLGGDGDVTPPLPGDSSAFGEIVAFGGSVGAGGPSGTAGAGYNGGGGGGGTSGTAGNGINKDGGAGRPSGVDTEDAGGGGAGQTANGSAATAGVGGAGGAGYTSSISGSSVMYGSGGGGGAASPGAGASGAGNGANGGASGGNATANRGGGGGGYYSSSSTTGTGGEGGSGIVIIRYPTGSITATGGTITTSGSDTIHTFTTSGTFTVSAIPSKTVIAAGGASGVNGGLGGKTTDSTGDTKYAGGNGSTGTGNRGGGGGAGSTGTGGNGGVTLYGQGGGEDGGNGGGYFNAEGPFIPHAPGGGAYSQTGNGNTGRRGEVRVTYEVARTANTAYIVGRTWRRHSGGLDSVTITPPSSVLPGDLMLLVVGYSTNSTTTTSMSGWTKVVDATNAFVDSANPGGLAVYWRRATGQDTYKINVPNKCGFNYVIYRILDAGTPGGDFTKTAAYSATYSVTKPGSYLWLAAGVWNYTQDTPDAGPAGYDSFITVPIGLANVDNRQAAVATVEKISSSVTESSGLFSGDAALVKAIVAVPYKAQAQWLDASVSLQVEFPAADERLYLSTTRDVRFLNKEDGIWQSLWMGVLQQDPLEEAYPHPMKALSAGGLVFLGDGNKLHSFIATATNVTEATPNRLVFDGTHYINWIQVTKSATFIGLANKLSDSLPSYVCYYEPSSEITRIFTIQEGATVGFIYDENCHIIDKSGQMRAYTGSSFKFYDALPPYFLNQKVTALPHRNGIVVTGDQVYILWQGQYPWPAGIWAYENGRLYHKHPLVFDPTTLNSFGAIDAPTGWRALYNTGAVRYAGATLYGADNTTTVPGVYSDQQISGVTVDTTARGYLRTPRYGSSQKDSVWQRVFAKVDNIVSRGLVAGSLVLKRRQESTPIGESIYAPSFTGTWTSPTTFTTTDAAFLAAVTAGTIAIGNEVIVRRGQGSGLRATISDLTGTSPKTVTIDSGLAAISSGSMTFSIENWTVIPNGDLVNAQSEWLQVSSEIRGGVELEELQITSQINETNEE